ncbi:MAG TPA: hypothetical protein VG502_02790 [Flexivirga sp.]|uniref:hypothetical protein n=1 Tax=Flexivirga sp. TaxID=1962927 RepID=UPI002BC568AF|nr:hypothetical protein [Flexivirga sp.]HWC21206.1 hypothetical protein [Flexivirga sp.]
MRFNPLHKDQDDVAAGDVREGDAAPEPVGRHTVETDRAYPADVARPVAAGPGVEKLRIAPRAPQFGSGLCGYLAAGGSYLVIMAVVHAVVARADTGHRIANALDGARATQPATVTWSGAIALLILAFVALLIGGYVCGTMARKHGLLEGLSVWLWAAVAAVVASLIIELSSAKYASLYQFDLFPRIRVGSWDSNSAAIITAIILAAGGLIGAVLGGAVGAAAHRRVRVDAASWSRG